MAEHVPTYQDRVEDDRKIGNKAHQLRDKVKDLRKENTTLRKSITRFKNACGSDLLALEREIEDLEKTRSELNADLTKLRAMTGAE